MKRLKAHSVIFFVLWIVAIAAGLQIMLDYENTPGLTANPPSTWPKTSSVQPDSLVPTLVMVVHPHCPCTRASLGELAILMARSPKLVKPFVLFYKPGNFGQGWEKSDLWQAAQRIPGVTPLIDLNGRECGKFHATISGQTFLYGADGVLLFHGGMTASRGHSGDNLGRDAIVNILQNLPPRVTETIAFGCRLGADATSCTTLDKDASQKL